MLFRRGDAVEFTHAGHGVITGTVKSVNPRSVTVENTSDGRRGWRVSPGMLRPAGIAGTSGTSGSGGAVAPSTRPPFSVGDTVAHLAEPELVLGVVTNVAPGRVEVYAGRFVVDDGGLLVKRPRRSEPEVMTEILGVYGRLSPENLHADGLRPRAEAARLAAALNRALRALFVEVGRRVPESEVYDWVERSRSGRQP